MPVAAVNGQELYYEDSGGHGPVIVFSHGLLMDREMFAPQVAALSDRYRCITWDERAHGETAGDEPPAPFSYYDSANDLAALLDHLGIETAILAGMSQGGFLSLRCALTHPQRVRALILLDTQAGLENPDNMPGYEQMIETWATHGLPDEIADTIAGIILGDGWSGTGAWQDKWRAWQAHNLIAAFQTLVSRDDITEQLSRIYQPSLVVHGDADMAIPMTRAEQLADNLPNAELVVVPGGGHAANLTHPAPVNAAIESFLERLG
ncbi:alpha/beta hydrolase [Endozoicomonas sp. G2_2]|uniref:alpha/beta fold hydrolase n=1 Tax=Endozoicomonas sp. G2_2 TaxID=2821092 RepID=UPI001AD96653|nr:alpha/beta hydrolase [Endozoicomonas sp. G2_2]MBO9468826.1 alpha/beta hydrolase [Endozoicomonas sp. G2_2]